MSHFILCIYLLRVLVSISHEKKYCGHSDSFVYTIVSSISIVPKKDRWITYNIM